METAQPNYFVIDLETLGLNRERHQIAEFGGVLLGPDYREIGSYQSYFYPRAPVDFEKSALKVNNLSIEFLYDNGKSGLDVCRNIIEFLDAYSTTTARDISVVCMNKIFDITRLEREFEHWGLTMPVAYANKWDIREMVRHFNLMSAENINLDGICSLFNIDRSGAHGALPDARHTAQAFRCLEAIRMCITPDWHDGIGLQLLNSLRK
jgi:DNA polymerase III epsilon subunit-like protein